MEDRQSEQKGMIIDGKSDKLLSLSSCGIEKKRERYIVKQKKYILKVDYCEEFSDA